MCTKRKDDEIRSIPEHQINRDSTVPRNAPKPVGRVASNDGGNEDRKPAPTESLDDEGGVRFSERVTPRSRLVRTTSSRY